MPYRILDPRSPDPLLIGRCALAVMAKAPRAGKVKTRLSPPLTLTESAALNICFLRDTAANLDTIPGAEGLICYTPVGDEAAFDGLVPASFKLIPQRGEDFGDRLLSAAQDILACGYSSVCLIDSDSPTVPARAFDQAVAALARPGDRIVLGPSHDGGYYLIGLKVSHAAPFERISWSTASVAEQTRQRCYDASLEVVDLPLWYDVDDGDTLEVLRSELLANTRPPFTTAVGYPAPATRQFLQDLDRTAAVASAEAAPRTAPDLPSR